MAQTGNVGIGTSDPQAKLHVAGDARIDNKLEIKNSSGQLVFSIDPETSELILFDTAGDEAVKIGIEESSNLLGSDDNNLSFTTLPPFNNGSKISSINSNADKHTGIIPGYIQVQDGATSTGIDESSITFSVPGLINPIVITADPENNKLTIDAEICAKELKVEDDDGNSATITPIGMETESVDGLDFFVDCFGISKLDGALFTGLSLDAADGITADGDTDIIGFLSKLGGSFKIDHPLDPTNKWLYHSFVESPDMMNIYNGNVTTDANGVATVKLPEYFGVLNNDFRYQLTPIGVFAQAIISKKVEDNKFEIKTSEANVEVSWQVTGIRQDDYAKDNRMEVEVEKTGWDKGKLRYDPNRTEPYTKGLQNHWVRHEEKRNRRERED